MRQTDVEFSEELPPNKRFAPIFGCILFGILITAIIATLLFQISIRFYSLESSPWITSAYFIGQLLSQPISITYTQKLSAFNGFIVYGIVFAGGVLISGLAIHESMLIAGLIIAGVGAGAIYLLKNFTFEELVPAEKQNVVNDLSNLCYGFGIGLGGIYGGGVNDTLGWRWTFLIQVPIIVIVTVLLSLSAKSPNTRINDQRIQKFDYSGFSTLMVTLVFFILGLSSGGTWASWNSPLVYISLLLASIFLILFLYIEENLVADPIIPLHLLRNRTVLGSALTYFFGHISNYGILYIIPVYLQLLRYNTTQAGLGLLAHGAGQILGTAITTYLMREGVYHQLNHTAHGFAVSGTGLLLRLSLSTAPWYPFLIVDIVGLGFGSLKVVNQIAIDNAVPQEDQVRTTSAMFIIQTIGSTLGVAITFLILHNVLKTKLESSLRGDDDAGTVISSVLRSFEIVVPANMTDSRRILDPYMVALKAVLAFCAGSLMTVLF